VHDLPLTPVRILDAIAEGSYPAKAD